MIFVRSNCFAKILQKFEKQNAVALKVLIINDKSKVLILNLASGLYISD